MTEKPAHLLPRGVRLALALFGFISLLIGLALGFYMLLAIGMSAGHGGDPIPDLRTLLVVLLPIPLIGLGVLGLTCTTMRRSVAMCVLGVLLLAVVSALASL